MKNNLKYSHPYIILGFALWRLISALFMRNAYDCPIAADAVLLMELVVAASLLIYSAVRIIQHLLWRRKTKNGSEDVTDSMFYTEKMMFTDFILLILLGIICFAAFTAFSFGNLAESWQFRTLGGLILIYDIAVSFLARKKLPIKIAAVCVATAISVIGIFGVAQLSLQKYESNSKNFLSFGGNPVSVTEFGIAEKNANEEEPIEKITPFAEYYIFRSRTHEETADGRKPFIYYYVLRSENEKIRVKYESGLKELSEKYGSTLRELQSDKWDYICREVHEGEEYDCGYAVKGNTIVYLDIIEDITFEEFFDKAYENIIKDKSTAQ